MSNGYKNSEKEFSVGWEGDRGFRDRELDFDPGEQEEDMTDGGKVSGPEVWRCVEGLLGSRQVTLVDWGQFWKTDTSSVKSEQSYESQEKCIESFS